MWVIDWNMGMMDVKNIDFFYMQCNAFYVLNNFDTETKKTKRHKNKRQNITYKILQSNGRDKKYDNSHEKTIQLIDIHNS